MWEWAKRTAALGTAHRQHQGITFDTKGASTRVGKETGKVVTFDSWDRLIVEMMGNSII